MIDVRHCFVVVVFSLFSVCTTNVCAESDTYQLPRGFVYVSDVAPDILCELRYFGKNNFVGRRIDGYNANKCIVTSEAMGHLNSVQKELSFFGLGLKIFDAYRPQQAVQDFVLWARDLGDVGQKKAYYPDVDKKDLFAKGYIAGKSGHSRGSTLDLTVVANGVEIDMGSPFDYFGEKSWLGYRGLSSQQRANRLLLKSIMEAHGFRSYRREWWHYTLVNEPYSETYFNFPVQ